ncbi:MAG: heat-inducible transcriptional repressor HrcA [Myxococcales bacterium]|nr:heat-inducible transcriptional repressor HrcA [Myxococcota bacterium]MDW8283194.1 heat-inducible transcriptional repressor HrcA [Myxococcales bacterium]
MPELNSRARKILSAITQEYLVTGQAVGSRRITRRYGVDLSPATVRNVMSDLEELGLLRQPHTSAGRIPTTQGLRFFVDSLLKVRQLSQKEREDLANRYSFSSTELDTALREAGKVLSELSTHTVVVVAPRVELDVLQHIEFVRLPDGSILAVLVNKSGRVFNKIIRPESPISDDELERIHTYLNQRLDGKSLSEVRALVAKELSDERTRYDALAQRALLLQAQALSAVPQEKAEVIVEGQANLLGHLLEDGQPPDPDRLKALFRTLEDRAVLLRLLEQTEAATGIQIFIGAESAIPELADHSVVASTFEAGDMAVGVLGVIGPTRMNYARIISLVDFTAQLLTSVVGRR